MKHLSVVWLLLLEAAAFAAGDAPSAKIVGRVVDARTGRPVPCTVMIQPAGGPILTDHPSFRRGFRSTGEFEKNVPAGEVVIRISRGFDFVAVERQAYLKAGEVLPIDVELRPRSPLRLEGWYTGDSHDHMIHGERNVLVDFAYAALAGRAEGLDYLALAQHWNIEEETPEALQKACERVSTPDFLLTWNLEEPKNYYRGDVSKCLGHGWTVALGGRTPAGANVIADLLNLSAWDYESSKDPVPNFESHALIHELGGIVSYSHPCRWWYGKWGGQGIYPAEERKFISNMAAELPFDTLAGPTYDTIDVMMQVGGRDPDDCALRLWYMLLNKGYQIPATGSTDATFDNPGAGVPGTVRMYTKLDGPFNLTKVAQALSAGRSFVTRGPLLAFEIGGHTSGDRVPIRKPATMRCRIRAWASGAVGERLTRVELIRNGEVVKTFQPNGDRTEAEYAFDVTEKGGSWYIARCRGSNEREVAIANPVYFESPGMRPPAPAPAAVELSVKDRVTGEPLDGICEVLRMVGHEARKESEVTIHAGHVSLEVPATARLRVVAPGYSGMTRSVFLDYPPLLESAFSVRPESLTDWSTFEGIRDMLKHVRLEFALEKSR